MLPITQLSELPDISGIYKVMDASGHVIYIGQANNIRTRWQQGHHKLGDIIAECGVAAYISWVEIPGWLLNRAEHAAICFYNPKLNKRIAPVV